MIESYKIIAVVVTYHPKISDLRMLLIETSPQVDSILIVDNGSFQNHIVSELSQDFKNINLISLNENMGIAYAQNIGLEYCIRCGATFALLLDQDSVPYPDMVSKLKSRFIELNGKLNNIAAVAPVTLDVRTNIKSYFLVGRYGLPYRYKPSNYTNPYVVINAGFVISSGTLVSLSVVRHIGGKRSNYFIDHVDTEWCYRARLNGYSLLGVHDAILKHSIGDEVKWIWLFYIRYIPYHSPLRDYYMFRNTVFCIKDIKQLNIWRALLVFRLFQFVLYFLIFAPDRIQRARMMIKGLIHGLKGIDGRLDSLSGKCHKIPITTLDPK